VILDANRSSHLTINNLAAALEVLVKHLAFPDELGNEIILPSEILGIAAELRDTPL
jgi:hypothetical protein